VTWRLVRTKQARKDARKPKIAGLKPQAERLLTVLQINPFANPPAYEKLVGDLDGADSGRINIRHRLVYQVPKEERIVKVLRLWTHYERSAAALTRGRR
jgi:Txe/YoeB family toxin of toxin-antitoxin system